MFRTIYKTGDTPGITFSDVSLTEQSHKASCDINCIVSRYQKTGILGDPNSYLPMIFGDFSGVGDFQEKQNLIAKVRQNFEALPSEVRNYFANDPSKFVDAFFDASKKEVLQGFGLIKADVSAVGSPADPVDQTLSAEAKAKASAQLPT